jgi:hypothetical protein
MSRIESTRADGRVSWIFILSESDFGIFVKPAELFFAASVHDGMQRMFWLSLAVFLGSMISSPAPAQQPGPYDAPPSPVPGNGPVVVDWTPPALAQLSSYAAIKNSFTLDRTMLNAAARVLAETDEPTRQAINRLDGVSVHVLRFGDAGVPDEGAVDSIRDAYHLRGWKHIVTTSHYGGPVHDDTSDVWVVMDGVNVRGAVVLAETPKSVTLVTVAGNLSPVDLLHLRGHFGIPRFNDNGVGDAVRH